MDNKKRNPSSPDNNATPSGEDMQAFPIAGEAQDTAVPESGTASPAEEFDLESIIEEAQQENWGTPAAEDNSSAEFLDDQYADEPSDSSNSAPFPPVAGTIRFDSVSADPSEAPSDNSEDIDSCIQEVDALLGQTSSPTPDPAADSPVDDIDALLRDAAAAVGETPAGAPPELGDTAELDASLKKILDNDEMPLLATESGDDISESASDAPEEDEAKEKAVKKRRPRRKNGYGFLGLPHIMATIIWAAIILIIGVTLGRVLWLCAADVLAFGRGDQPIVITITEDDSLEDVSAKLKDKGLIKYPDLFELYVNFADKWDQISEGTFALNTHMDYMALVNSMNYYSDSREIVEVVIPEGYTCAQIFSLLESKGVCSAEELSSWASGGELEDYWFLKDVTRGTNNCLEGFLFPDTYKFYTNDEPRRVLEKLLDNFEYRFDQAHISSIEELNKRLNTIMADNGFDEAYIADHQISVYEVVTIASMIEKETANTLESYTISSVIYNRLYNWGDTPPFLNIDAAVIYALGEHKEELTAEDLKIDSPYNTYLHTGLTPGAICNPGLHSLNAALDPDDTNYFYYAMDPETGVHHFSETEEGHNEFLESLEDND